MQLKGIQKKEKNQVELTIEVGKEEFEKAMEQAYRIIARWKKAIECVKMYATS